MQQTPCDPKSYDSNDAVADSGGQWRDVPKSKATLFDITKYSHADFDEMMNEKVLMNTSVEEGLLRELEKIK